MKKTFDQTKKETAKISANAFGIRSIAILMFFVMLFTAIGSGSVLSALAVTKSDDAADNAAAVETVNEASVEPADDIADEPATEEIPAYEYDTEEALLGRKSDSDLAATGANADLAGTGANYYLHIGEGSAFRTTSGNLFSYDSTNEYYYCDFAVTASKEYVFVINTTSGTLGDSNKSSSTQTVTSLASSWNATGASFDYNYYGSNNYDGYDAFKFKCKSSITIRFTFTSTFANGVTLRTTTSGGSSSTDKYYLYGHQFGGWDWDASNPTAITEMSKDATTGYYYVVKTVANSSNYYRIWKKDGAKHYGVSSDTQVVLDGARKTATEDVTSKAFYILDNKGTGVKSGTIVVWWDPTNKQTWITSYENTHNVTFSAGTGGTISPSGTVAVGESTATTVTATANPGYKFSSWTNGTGITQKTNTASGDNQTQTITTKSSGTHTVAANFTKKNLTVSKGTHTGGDFTLSKTSAQIGDTITISGITANKGYQLATSNPVKYVYNGTTKYATKSGDNYTFTMPGYTTTVSVTFTGLTGTISKSASPAAGLDTFYIANGATATNDYSTYTVGSNARYARVKAKDAYTFDKFVITYGDGSTETVNASSATYNSSTKFYTTQLNTDGSKFSDANVGSISVVAYFTKKPTHKVTVVSNNNALGTATASVTDAYEGQTVTLTAKEDTGSFSSWSVASSGVTVSNNQFTMGSSDVAITATFVAYSGTSNFYYNSYGDNGQPASSRYGAQMQKAKIGGQTYSYYHVTDRTESDQLFTVSYGTPKNNSWDCFFEVESSWGSTTPKALFYATDEKNLGDWADMNYIEEKNSKKRYKIAIPDGARSVRFKHGSDESNELYFSTGYNGWYTNSSMSSVTAYKQSPPVPENFWENFNSSKYTDAFDSKGFWGYNANRGESHAYTKPKDLGAYSSDYYILVLEKNKTYTINGVTKTITNDPEIIWLPELPDSGDTIKVYAKDGAIAGYGQTYADLADTTVLKADGTTSAGATKYTSTGNQTYEVYKAQPGETITIKTTIGLDKDGNALTSPTAASLRAKYYVRGFMVNGEVPKNTQITKPDTTNGVYTLTYTVPEDYTGKYIEITPVYFLVDTSANPVVTFRATNFPKGQHNWGDTPYVYPFYGKLGSYNNSFGVYAGQPMFFYNGQYTMQIPQKSTAWAYDSSATYGAASSLAEVNNITVSGVTMSNGYYDTVHKLIMGYGDNSASADHVQTYDYGDFYKIFNEKKPVDNIVFDFKYETTKHNFESNPAASYTKTQLDNNYGTNGNGFEDLKNFHGRNVDLFGDPLSGDQLNATPVYVVSIGGVNGSAGVENIAGYYATEWMVYGSSDGSTYSRISAGGKNSIPPEVLVLNDDDTTSFNDTTYPSADATHTLTNWKALYTALEAYRGKPVKISYEAADAQIGAGNYATSGSGGATRNDGRWLYSKTGESITSKIKIQYSADNGKNYTDLDATTPQVEGLSAYFTNTEVYGAQTYATTIDPDKTFDFEAKTTNASYKFVGWYMDDDNKTLITTDNDGSTERSGSYTFIARFKLVTEGQLILSHSVDTDTIGGTVYDGAGTVTIGAVVKDGDGNTRKTYAPSTSDITIDNGTYISSESNYTIDVTLTATRGNNSALGTTLLATPDGQDAKFFDYGDFTLSADGKTRTYTFTVNVSDLYTDTTQTYKNLIYHSYFKNYVFNYTVNYEFNDRFGNAKIYNRAGTLTAPEAEAYVYKATDANTGKDNRYLKKEFFESLAPYESNFQQDIKWNLSDSVFTEGTNYVYTCNTHIGSTPVDENKKVDVTFVLPYQHNNGIATLNSEGVGTAATATNYAMIKESEETDNRVTFGEIPVLTGNHTNGIYNEAEKEHWIAAPLKLSNGTFFSHWSVKTTDTNTEVARCYFPGFNFLAYDNYEITAVYGSAAVDMSKTGVSTAVTYLDTTRNQWNALIAQDAAVPSVNKNNTTDAGDILYNDFVLSYNYNGVEIHQGGSDTNDINELGIVVERIKELDKNSDDTYDTRISSYTNLAPDTAKITNAAKTAGDPTTGQKTIKDTDTNKYYYKQSINKTALDNKDRIVFFEAFSNTAGWNSEKQRPVGNYSYKKYVYRAYTYITYNDGGETKTVLSETPAYFIMYDIATADYSAN